ncbi:MAG: hypothetical protein JO168_23755 [Solirubrobacterales bacterium]|nr:hypothetical protein [Solirubrobacterales bacterium]
MGVVISYLLVPVEDVAHTRLLMKLVAARGRLTAPLLAIGDLIMAGRRCSIWPRLAGQGPVA